MSLRTSPLMQQYAGIKKDFPDMLLFFRMGDFYEMFFEDAKRAATLLNITLTQRGSSGGESVPMAGVPAHSVDQYLARLIKIGESVAVCEQLGEADGKGPMQREVTRVVTPGTLVDCGVLAAEKSCILLALCGGGKTDKLLGYAWLDLSRAVFRGGSCAPESLPDILARLNPAEILLAEGMAAPPVTAALRFLPDWRFAADTAERLLCEHFGVRDTKGFGLGDSVAARRVAVCAAGALLRYAKDACRQPLPDVLSLSGEANDDFIGMTAATRNALELTTPLSGSGGPTLFSAFNRCKTPMGARMLVYFLHHPPRRRQFADERHDAVEHLIRSGGGDKSRQVMAGFSDVERITASIGVFAARPRELAALRQTMENIPALFKSLDREPPTSHTTESPTTSSTDTDKIDSLLSCAAPPPVALALLQKTLAAEPAALAREGGVIAAGWCAELDELRALKENARAHLEKLAQAARRDSGLDNVRVEYNRIHGFFIEVSKAQAARAPAHWQRRQTLKNAERFITPELKLHEEKTLAAEGKSRALERSLYDQLLESLKPHVPALRDMAAALAELDMLACFAATAKTLGWQRPQLSDEPIVRIIGGRHPVVESVVEHFVGNDTHLDEHARLHIVTGPNMGGKSTYLRQSALIVILARCGAFVPAESAEIGDINRIFTRIGAADDLAGGRSTFMVEMTEAAEIAHNADSHSLVLLDEIGRGTSTFDGLSLAWALAEQLLEKNKAMTLFATHYLELTALAEQQSGAINRHLAVSEHGGETVFLHRVEDGAASRSYGLQVAKIAGLPATVIQRAAALLHTLEKPSHPMPLFDNIQQTAASDHSAAPPAALQQLDKIQHEIQNLDPDSMTPREAHEALYQLKKIITADNGAAE